MDDPQTADQQNPSPEPTPPVEQSTPEPLLTPAENSPTAPTPPNPPDVPTPEENPQPAPIEEPPVPEPTPTVTSEPPPVDVLIPNFRLPFNGDFPITFLFNAQATTDEMKAKFAQWGISGHHGIDFGLPEGTEVVAVDSGKVLQSSENNDYGISVTIQHSWGQSLYAHLKETKVSEDQEVKAGDLIGISGQTGVAFGPHLHFGIKPNNPNETNGYLGFIDPTQYLPVVSQISQTPNIPNPPNSPDNSQLEPEKPKEEVPTPEPKPEEPKPVEVPVPDVSINIEPIGVSPQPSIPSNPSENNLKDFLKLGNPAKQEKRDEHLQKIVSFAQEKKQVTNQDVRDLVHVSQTTATRYLEALVGKGILRMDKKAKATTYLY